jgi:hypothetical protein
MSSNSPYIPDTFRKTFTALEQEVVNLWFKIRYTEQLFSDPDNVGVINKTAPEIFRYIAGAMLCDITLSISRLIDPPQSMGKANLSLLFLARQIENNDLRQHIEDAVIKLGDINTRLKPWRDKKFTHNDLSLHLAECQLPVLTKGDLTSASTIIADCLKHFHRILGDTCVVYDMPMTDKEKDGRSLMFYLKYGLLSSEEDRANNDEAILMKIQGKQKL